MNQLQLGRSEINLIRLIAQCEALVAVDPAKNEWRLKKYIEKLDELYSTTSQSARRPDNDKLKEYNKKIGFLKDFTSSKLLTNATNKLMSPSSTNTIPSIASTPAGKQIRQAAVSRYNKQMKTELFAKKSGSDDLVNVLTHRSTTATSGDTDTMLRQQQDQHERIAEDIIALTRNLKHNITVSGKIIKSDTAVLKEASKKADSNVTRLKQESSRIESHLHKGTNWWLWIAIAAVCATFIFMIFFIRFFPKLR